MTFAYFLCQFICNATPKSSFYCVLKVTKVNLGLIGTKTEWVLPWGWPTNLRYSSTSPGPYLPKFYPFVYPKVSFNATLTLQRSHSTNSNAHQVFLCAHPGCFSEEKNLILMPLHGSWLLWRCEMKDQWCLPYLRDRVYRTLTPPAPTHRIHFPIPSLLSSQVKSFQLRFEALGFKYSHKPFAILYSQGLQEYPL